MTTIKVVRPGSWPRNTEGGFTWDWEIERIIQGRLGDLVAVTGNNKAM